MNLSIVSAKYVAPLKVELHFNDDTIKTIDVGAFIRNHPHPQYNSYLTSNPQAISMAISIAVKSLNTMHHDSMSVNFVRFVHTFPIPHNAT